MAVTLSIGVESQDILKLREVLDTFDGLGTLPQSHPWDVRFHIWTQAIVENGPIFSLEHSSMTAEIMDIYLCIQHLCFWSKHNVIWGIWACLPSGCQHRLLDGSWGLKWSTQHLHTLYYMYWYQIYQWQSYPQVSAWAVKLIPRSPVHILPIACQCDHGDWKRYCWVLWSWMPRDDQIIMGMIAKPPASIASILSMHNCYGPGVSQQWLGLV